VRPPHPSRISNDVGEMNWRKRQYLWPVGKKMRAAYHADSALLAQAQLQALARELDKTLPAGRRQPARGTG